MIIAVNKNFYKLPAIKRTIEAYRGLADFKVKNEGGDYKIILEKVDPEAKEVIEDEFLNYVLAEMKNG